METIIGVRFRTAGKIYHFSPGQLTIAKGQHVIVETARGMECGRVVTGPEEIEPAPDAPPLKVIQRIANAHDLQRVEDNRKHEKEARVICKKKIREHGLPMKLVSVEYTFDLNKIIFTSRRTVALTSATSSRTLPLSSARASSCARSACAMRPR